MGVFLAIFGLLLAAGGCVLAWRARRASLRLALEMIELRDRLAQAEQGRAAAEAATRATIPQMAARSPTREETPDPDLLPRVMELEALLRNAVSAGPSSGPSSGRRPGDDPRVHVRTQLEQRGFERVSILGAAEDGRYLVEAVRHGVVSKGHAEIAPDGVVYWRSMSSLRAFP